MSAPAKEMQGTEEIETAGPHNPPNTPDHHTGWDKAAKLLDETDHTVQVTPENNARVVKKVDLHILPIILGIYFLQSLDKATLAYASVFGLIEKANLHGKQYSWLGSVVYAAQLVCQPLVAFLLVKMPLGKFLAASVILWGSVLSAMTAADTFPSLLVCRMFLGAFESGLGNADSLQVRFETYIAPQLRPSLL